MTSFILDVLKNLLGSNSNLSEFTFVLPSKRAGVFLKSELSKITDETIFSPTILSIETFVEELSQLKPISNTEQLFEFYTSYRELTPKDQTDGFDSFSKWAQILLQDFNEIDRYLIEQEKIFNYLSAIEDLKHWSLQENKTTFIKRYLLFWKTLPLYYNHFAKNLISKGFGYQGLIYREAVKNIDTYIQNNPNGKHVFLGFNALNTAEEIIIKALLKNGLAQIYWDIDAMFMDNKKHDTALFTRQHKTSWSFFKSNPFNWITTHYTTPKNISVFGIPKSVGQAKHIGFLLNSLQEDNPSLESTAVVLGDENLLTPVLNSIPTKIGSLNITMGLPLNSSSLANLFDALLSLPKLATQNMYYKEVINILSHEFIRPLFHVDGLDYATKLIETIQENNLVFLNHSRLKEIANKSHDLIDCLFFKSNAPVDSILKNCTKLILNIKVSLDVNKSENLLALEHLFRFNKLFNELFNLNYTYSYITDISTLHSLYKELLSSETLDFQGEPLEGLQIMGMLESRVLDFETVIIASVNEGVLPAGKSQNSFIPFDVKLENKLPTYKEKDAVYTYHFYRLLQRAKNVFILYNTEADTLVGGEKSRFITQLELEGIHDIKHEIIAPQVPSIPVRLNTIKKTTNLHKEIILLASKGFSPSSLTNYIRNPIDFYYQSILKIQTQENVEETVAANTLGTVIHNTLEDFYKPLEGKCLTQDIVSKLKSKIASRVTVHFKNEYKEGDITKGKNLIIYEISKRYISNFLDKEMEALKSGKQIIIRSIEAEYNIELSFPELDFPIRLKGKVDRVDECDGVIRIIDYKSGSVSQNQVEIVDWEMITTDYKKYSKSFQLLTYAYMMWLSKDIHLPVETGIISFKNLKSGLLKFAKKDSKHSRKKTTLVSKDTLLDFEIILKALIKEICNPNIDFMEKEV